ncbi:hypothetical protein TWF481_003128 [Arthrobotrys musiformis]|uniref:Uncharacterized protein n=1 Tax=Arthrobotrys musiformis TaxID=47236 RepID=A0AAV9VVP9_9PEZI
MDHGTEKHIDAECITNNHFSMAPLARVDQRSSISLNRRLRNGTRSGRSTHFSMKRAAGGKGETYIGSVSLIHFDRFPALNLSDDVAYGTNKHYKVLKFEEVGSWENGGSRGTGWWVRCMNS